MLYMIDGILFLLDLVMVWVEVHFSFFSLILAYACCCYCYFPSLYLLYRLPKRRRHEKKATRPFEFLVDDLFNVDGVGAVASGFVNGGKLQVRVCEWGGARWEARSKCRTRC